MTCNVAFIGLGVMGYPMAGYISKAGHNVTVYNRTSTKVDKWLSEYKGSKATTPAKAAEGAEYIFTCVGNDSDLREVTFGDNGIFKTIKKGSVYIDNTTASATIAREIYDYSKKNSFGFLDAPVSGGQAGAENGALTVMIGGDQEDYDKAKDKIDCYSKKMKLLGGTGSGQLAKMVNQICIAGLVQGLSEGINFGMKAGLNMEDVIEVISKGAAQSWQMDNRYKTMIEDKFEFGFAVDWMRKDLKIALEEAKKNNSLLPITEIVDKYYDEVQQMGGNRWDTSSLIRRFKKK
jgi:3-hydroxyisobutyrate dehydrogenase